MRKAKLIKTSTVPVSLDKLLEGQLRFLSKDYNIIAVSSDQEYLKKIGEREGVDIYSVQMNRQISPISDLKSLFRLYKFLVKTKPLMIHSITPKAGLLSMIAGWLAGVPIRMHTFTGLIFPYRTGLLQKVLIAMDKLLCACATNIYPEGKGVMNDLTKYKITSKPLRVLANGNVNGIRIDYFNPNLFSLEEKSDFRKKYNIKDSDFVFIFVGRLVRDKGINELVNVFNSLTKKYTTAKLLLVGPYESELDPLEDNTLSIIDNNHSIISVGMQSDIRKYMAISNALVFPSYREGFPNVVIEAGAMELPAIVTNISGCNEIIVEGKNGTIVPIKNEDSLKEKMELFLNDTEYLAQLKCNAREMIVSRYKQDIVWDALLEEYKLLEKKYVSKLS